MALLRRQFSVLELAMAKPTKRSPRELQIEAFAKRRAGGTYIAAAIAVKDRLLNLRSEYLDAPNSYRGYLVVGICTCLESHLKYCYAYAAERFADHPDLLKELYKDISVDIDTLISTSARSFHLSDVVAANIKVSSLDTYVQLASAFFTAIQGERHRFPWDLSKVFGFGDDEEGKRLQAKQLDRLRQVFAARHDFVHETTLTEPLPNLIDPREYIDDAIHLINLFDKHLENIEMRSQVCGYQPRRRTPRRGRSTYEERRRSRRAHQKLLRASPTRKARKVQDSLCSLPLGAL